MSRRRNPYAGADSRTRAAKAQGYPARSVFKLEEIDRRVRLLRPGQHVLDLGAAPGSWSLYASSRVGTNGRVLAVDISPIGQAFPENVVVIQGDALTLENPVLEKFAPYDVVLSDMAPNTSGNKVRDQAYSFELFMRALEVATGLRRAGLRRARLRRARLRGCSARTRARRSRRRRRFDRSARSRLFELRARSGLGLGLGLGRGDHDRWRRNFGLQLDGRGFGGSRRAGERRPSSKMIAQELHHVHGETEGDAEQGRRHGNGRKGARLADESGCLERAGGRQLTARLVKNGF
jgi:23S rRNA (uridine2552-2'-O)-methyltransferase